MKFSEFCQKNAVAVALLAAIIALGFSVYDHFLFEKPVIAVAPAPGGARFGGGPGGPGGGRFGGGFGRNRAPRRSEAYLAKFREIVSLREQEAKLAEEGYRAGGISIRDVYVGERDLALARLALMRMEGESRSSAGAAEALVNLKFCELLKQCDEEAYKSGGIDLKAYTQSKIALAEAELKMLKYENLLKRNETFAKLAGEFSAAKCNPEVLKALVEAESIRPVRRGGPGAPDGMPRPSGAPQPPGGHHRVDAVPPPGK